MDIRALRIEGSFEIVPRQFHDDRGLFLESFRGDTLASAIGHRLDIIQSNVSVSSRGTAWFDTGTFKGLLDASQFVYVVEARQGRKIGCVEEIAWRNGWLSNDEFSDLADPLVKSGYGTYLHSVLAEGRART